MATITEDYVSFEIAKLLKEKGFNEPCISRYCTDGRFDTSIYHYKNSEINKDSYNAPTLQMAMKWLREVHGVFIYIKPWLRYWGADCARYKEHRFVLEGYVPHVLSIDNPREYKSIDKYCVPTYEEACEAAIKYCLENLI